MAKKKQFVTAAAAFAVAASAVAPAITADAAMKTVRLSSDYVRVGDLDATLDKEYKGSEIYWYKSSVDMNKLGVFQTAKGFVKGQGIRVEKRVRVLNHAQEIKPTSEFVFEQGVPVSGIRVQPVLFADGVEYMKPLFVAGFETDKVGEFEGTLTYSNKAYGTVTKTVKYKVVNSTPEIEEFKATSADALTVNFNKEIDFSKAKFEIKRGSVVVNATVVPSEDKKSAKLELASKLFEGDYTVTVSGLTEDALSSTTAVMSEKVNAIELSSTTAPTNEAKKEAKVGYKVMNQYGEDVTSSPLASGIEWTASNGVTAEDDNKGVLTLTAATNAEIKKGDMVAVTGINASTNTVISKVITIADVAISDSLSFGSVYHKDGKPFSGVTSADEFALLVNGMDQYGKALTAEEINEDFIFTSSNPAVLALDKVVAGLGADKDKLGLKFTAGSNYSKGGTVIITAISKATGKVAQYEVKVAAAPALAAFNISAPAEMIAANETVEIPFTAVDQFGNALTKFDELNGKVTFSSSEKLKLEKGKDGVAVLKYTAGAKGFDVQVATVPATGKVSQLNIDVKEAAYAATIESLKDVNTTVAVGGQTTLDYSNFVVKDQYGRTFDLKGKLGSGQDDLKVVVAETENEGAVAVTDDNLTADASKFIVSGSEKGTETLTFSLMKDNKAVSTSPLKVTFTAVDKSAYASFEIAEVGTLYADGSVETHTQDFKVYGVKADGSKVLLPDTYYTVIKDDSVLDLTDGKLNSVLDADDTNNSTTKFGDKNEITSKITVVVDGEKSPVTLMKEVTISKIAPKAETIEFKKDTVVDGVAKFQASDLAGTADATALNAILKVTDQYGVEVSAVTPVITVTNLDDNTAENDALAVDKNGTTTVDIENALASDMFIVTYLLNGKTVTVKGLVEGTLSAEQLINAVGGTYKGNLSLTANGLNDIVYGPASGMRTIDGNVTITGDASGEIDLRNLTITGNLTVNTPNATVNNSATVNGTIDIQDVKDGTWNELANGNAIVVNDTTKIRVVIGENVRVKELTLNQPTTLEVSNGATFEKPVVVVKPSTIVSSQPIQVQPEQGVDVTLKSSKEDKGVVVSGSGDAVDSSESIEKARLENLTNLLKEAKDYNYDPTLDFKSISTLNVSEKAITLDLTEDVEAISNYLIALKKDEETKDATAEYAAGRYALNTLARYMGALERTEGSSVEEILYDGVSYTWDADGTLQGSNWTNEEGTTLMSVVFPNIEQSLEFKLVDDQGFEIDITFNVEWPELTSNTENPTN